MPNNTAAALRKAQEPIDRHGDWHQRLDRNGDSRIAHGFAGEIVILVLCLGCLALAYAAVTGKIYTQTARLFAVLGI